MGAFFSLAGYSALYAVAVVLLLWVTKRHRRYYVQAKTVVSFLFMLGSGLTHFLGERPLTKSSVLLFVALFFCLLGDVLLGFANHKTTKVRMRPFLAGAVTFSLAHLMFCGLFYSVVPFSVYDILPAVIMVFVILMLNKKELVKLRKMKPLAIVYTMLVSIMTTKAVQLAVYYSPLPSLESTVVLLGSVLFCISDFILLFLYFGAKRGKYLRYLNLSTYYIGVYLMGLWAFWL